MGKVISGLSVSLDGFIAGPNDSPERPLGEGGERLFQWYADGDTEFVMPSGTMTVRVPAASAALMREVYSSIGALVSGRRTFDITNGWEGRHPLDVPVFIVTHRVPQEWLNTDAPFTFITDGVESAVEQAMRVAGNKNVAVGAASITQQCLQAGLLDEVHVDLVPVLLGKGVRLFEHLDGEPIGLERIGLVEAPGVTHLTFRVIK